MDNLILNSFNLYMKVIFQKYIIILQIRDLLTTFFPFSQPAIVTMLRSRPRFHTMVICKLWEQYSEKVREYESCDGLTLWENRSWDIGYDKLVEKYSSGHDHNNSLKTNFAVNASYISLLVNWKTFRYGNSNLFCTWCIGIYV